MKNNNEGWVNLTPHSIRVMNPDGTLAMEIPPSGQVARVAVTRTLRGVVAGIPIYGSSTGSVTGLLPSCGSCGGRGLVQVDGLDMECACTPQRLIVSLAVRAALPSDARLFSPGELIRGPVGQPVGCFGLDSNGGVA